MKFNEQLTELRLRRGFTQAQVAARSGIAQPTVSAIERGRRTPNVEIARALVRATGHRLIATQALIGRPSVSEAAEGIRSELSEGSTEGALRTFLTLAAGLAAAGSREKVILTDTVPAETGSPLWDAALAALVDHRLERLLRPDWTTADRFTVKTPADPLASLSALPVDSDRVPADFRSHGVLIEADTLESV
jgi:transcriptional regulator with XRE-family HTH domain